MKKILIIFFLFGLTNLYSQITLLSEFPFRAGEEVRYDAIYEWGFIEIRAGSVGFHVDSVTENNESYFHFSSFGYSKPKYDWIYTIRDTFQSKVRIDDFQPVYFKRNTLEGSYQVNNETFFQEDENQILMLLENSIDGYRETELVFEPHLLDLQTAVYYARMLNFKDARMGDGYEFNIIIDGKPYSIPIRYEGKETVHLGKERRYSCYRISTQVIEGTIFKSGQTIKIWVSDDGKQIPVKVEAPIIVGRVKAELIE